MQNQLSDAIQSKYQKLAFAFIGKESGIDYSDLPLEEQLLSESAHESRKVTYALGRLAAKQALDKLGVSGPVTRGKNKEPIWPDGVTGSIAHIKGNAAALVGKTSDYLAVGIDIERIDRSITVGFAEKISTSAEIRWINRAEDNIKRRALLLFSAKEALYKALHPITKTYFGFQDADLKWNEKETYFTVYLLKDLNDAYTAGSVVEGNAFISDEFIVTWVVIEK